MAFPSRLPVLVQRLLQIRRSVRGRPHSAEPMFDKKTKIRNRLVDTFDLVVDFATLGEYGLEPLEAEARPCTGGRCVEEGRKAGWEAFATPRRGDQCVSASPLPTASMTRRPDGGARCGRRDPGSGRPHTGFPDYL